MPIVLPASVIIVRGDISDGHMSALVNIGIAKMTLMSTVAEPSSYSKPAVSAPEATEEDNPNCKRQQCA